MEQCGKDEKKSTIINQLKSQHNLSVHANRKYLKVVIECLMFCGQQNIAPRGHTEDRKDLDAIC